jgi:pimeloyl-ACP methyl ester carboxylesterase
VTTPATVNRAGGAQTPGKHRAMPDASLPPALDAASRAIELGAAGAVNYYVDTATRGRPLVLLHSVNAAPSAIEMAPLFEHYRRLRPVYAPELPGFGRSERADLPYSPTLYADFVIAFLRRVVREPSDVVAFSLSAEFCARAVAEAPELFNSLALISPTGFSRRQPPRGKAMDGLHKFLRLPGVGDGIFRLLTSRRSIRYFLGLGFDGPTPEALVDYAYLTAHQPGAKYAPFRFLSMKLFTHNAHDELYASLQLPVLVLYDRDPNVSFERLDEFGSRPNWRLCRIAPTLGLPHWERTDETVAALDDFWSQTPGGVPADAAPTA